MSNAENSLKTSANEFAERHAIEHEPELQRQARTRAKQSNWPLSPVAQSQLLTFIARALRATSIISVGTGSVLEALALATGLENNGQLTAVDSSARGIAAIRTQITDLNAEHDDAKEADTDAGNNPGHVTLRAVNASPSVFLPRLNPASYDLIVVSGDDANYQSTFLQAPYLLKEHGIIVFTDMLGTAAGSKDNTKAQTMLNLIHDVESSEDFISALTPTGSGLLIATRA